MIKTYKHWVLILLIFIFLMGCQSLREGLEGKKKSDSGDEFLIESKNPLVLPPDYSKLPSPNAKVSEETETNFDLENIINKGTKNNKKNNQVKSSKSLEKTILEKIKKN